MTNLALSARRITKSFKALGNAPAKIVIDHLSFELEACERLAIIGPSGCGKSTLLNMVAGLESLTSGEIERAPEQRLSFVFQEPRLLPWRSVADNLRLVLPNIETSEAKIDHWLQAVGLRDAKDVFASHLSLGMARRVAIARAFIVQPRLLLMDEPFVSLDAANTLRLQSLLLELLDAEKTSLLFVTHDLREAIRLCDRLLFLSPAPSRLLFDCVIPLDRPGREDDMQIDALRASIIREHNLDAGRLQVSSRQSYDGSNTSRG